MGAVPKCLGISTRDGFAKTLATLEVLTPRHLPGWCHRLVPGTSLLQIEKVHCPDQMDACLWKHMQLEPVSSSRNRFSGTSQPPFAFSRLTNHVFLFGGGLVCLGFFLYRPRHPFRSSEDVAFLGWRTSRPPPRQQLNCKSSAFETHCQCVSLRFNVSIVSAGCASCVWPFGAFSVQCCATQILVASDASHEWRKT